MHMQKTNSMQRNVPSMKYSKIILFGPPGTGKGTQAEKISVYYDVPHISTGDIFRTLVKNNDPLGIELKEKYWGKGKLVPDDITIKILKERIAQDDCTEGFLLDGFPRTLNQAKMLKDITSIDLVIEIYSEKDLIVKRLSNRRTCTKCGKIYGLGNMPQKDGYCSLDSAALYQRDDDKVDVIAKRFDEYENLTKPLIKFYKKEKLLKTVDGNGTPDDVFKLILKILGKKV